ncbi:MAG: hypothetical protein WKF66_21130 [Pedobacter sp.]
MKLSLTKRINLATKPVLIFTALLLIFASCKKQDDETKSLKSKMVGKWQLAKVETTVAGSATTTVNGGSNDYVEFKSGEDDIVEINLAPSLQSGTYSVTVGNTFYMSIGAKLHAGAPTLINDNKFEFTATEEKSTPNTVRKYFLVR